MAYEVTLAQVADKPARAGEAQAGQGMGKPPISCIRSGVPGTSAAASPSGPMKLQKPPRHEQN